MLKTKVFILLRIHRDHKNHDILIGYSVVLPIKERLIKTRNTVFMSPKL